MCVYIYIYTHVYYVNTRRDRPIKPITRYSATTTTTTTATTTATTTTTITTTTTTTATATTTTTTNTTTTTTTTNNTNDNNNNDDTNNDNTNDNDNAKQIRASPFSRAPSERARARLIVYIRLYSSILYYNICSKL